MSEETRLSRHSDETEYHKAVKEYLLDYNLLKKDLIKVNDGNDISSKYAVRTEPEEMVNHC